MNTFLVILMLLSVIAVAATLRTLANGGHGSPPASHVRDERFLPPSSLLS